MLCSLVGSFVHSSFFFFSSSVRWDNNIKSLTTLNNISLVLSYVYLAPLRSRKSFECKKEKRSVRLHQISLFRRSEHTHRTHTHHLCEVQVKHGVLWLLRWRRCKVYKEKKIFYFCQTNFCFYLSKVINKFVLHKIISTAITTTFTKLTKTKVAKN